MSEQINDATKKEHEMKDRKNVYKKKNLIHPLLQFVSLAAIVLIFCFIIVFFIGLAENGIGLEGTLFHSLLYLSIGIFVLTIVLAFAFNCIFGIKTINKRVNKKIDSLVETRNLINEQDGVFAVHEPERWERSGGPHGSTIKIHHTLNLWKREFTCNLNMK